MAQTQILVCVHFDHDDMTLGQGHGTHLGHGQQLWNLSRWNKGARIMANTDLLYSPKVCSVV